MSDLSDTELEVMEEAFIALGKEDGQYSIAATLEFYDLPLTERIVALRVWQKLLANFLEETEKERPDLYVV